MSPEAVQQETRRYGRAAGLLSAGIGLGGLMIYAYFGLASHNLSADDYGELVVQAFPEDSPQRQLPPRL